jgi:hypothetical protein
MSKAFMDIETMAQSGMGLRGKLFELFRRPATEVVSVIREV